MLKKILQELIAIRKELQDIKLILKFQCLPNYRTERSLVDGKRVRTRYVLPDPLEALRKEERTLQEHRRKGNHGPFDPDKKIQDQTL